MTIRFDFFHTEWINEEHRAPYLQTSYWNADGFMPEALADCGFHTSFRDGGRIIVFNPDYPQPDNIDIEAGEER